MAKAFDPDAYLAKFEKKPDSGFDPDAYLAKLDKREGPASIGEQAESGLAGFGKQATFGYLPEIQAATEPVTTKILDVVTGKKVSESLPSYKDRKQIYSQEMARAQAQAPVAFGAGEVAGAIAGTAPVTRLPGIAAKAAPGLLGRVVQAAKAGAVVGGIAKPEEGPEPEGLQLPERLKGAATGAAFGGAAQLGGEVLLKGAKAIAKAPEVLEQLGAEKAFKATGAMLKDFRKSFGKGRVTEIGKEVVKHKVVAPGDTVADVAKKSSALREETGKKIGDLYEKVEGQLKDPKLFDKLPSRLQSTILQSGFKPKEHGEVLKAQLKKEMQGKVGGKQAFTRLENYLDDLALSHEGALNPKAAQEIKTNIQDSINWAKASNELPEFQQGLNKIQAFIRKKIDQQFRLIDRAVKTDAAKELKAANKTYGAMAEVSRISQDRVAREAANRAFSPSDYASAIGGAGIGSIAAGGSPEERLKGAALGAGLGLLNRTARRYGNPVLAQGLLKSAEMAKGSLPVKAAAGVAKGLESVPPQVVGGAAGLLGQQRRK